MPSPGWWETMPASEAVLVCENLHVARGGTPILTDVSLSIRRGDRFLIRGPSGSGKTTLFQVLGLLTAPDGGRLLVDGQPAADLSERERATVRGTTVGLVFQDFQLIPDMTAWENARLPQEHGHLDTPDASWLESVFDTLGIADLADQYPATLSGGEKQRVATARALANRPSVVLADEPTGQLDPDSSETLLDLLADVQAETDTALGVVSHDRSLAARFDTVYALRDGTLRRASDDDANRDGTARRDSDEDAPRTESHNA
jgi:putative ABC transport system ATP-binding protein